MKQQNKRRGIIMKSSKERDKLHRTIWTLAYNLRGALDGYVKTIGQI